MPMKLSSLLTNRQSPIKPAALENVRVAAPCPASWEQMAGDDLVRFCAECKLNVYNLSDMTRREAEQLIATHEGRLCVRFYRRADGTIITQNCPRGLRVVIQRVSRVAGAALSAMMAATSAFSQTPAQPAPNSAANKKIQPALEVAVLDPTGAMVQNAKITLCLCKSRVTMETMTDAGGVAHFSNLMKGTYDLSVQAPGFRTSRQAIKVKQNERVQVQLQVAKVATTVEVKAEPMEVMGTTVGVIVTTENPLPPMPISSGRPAPMR
ncbi:MAG TPA: carboxypeptidase-like regulatory domain-containing protein [Candidatus Angelobacter sp.]